VRPQLLVITNKSEHERDKEADDDEADNEEKYDRSSVVAASGVGTFSVRCYTCSAVASFAIAIKTGTNHFRRVGLPD
jgi:hypothetical protein